MSHAQVAEQLLFCFGIAVLLVFAVAAISAPLIWWLDKGEKTGSAGLK